MKRTLSALWSGGAVLAFALPSLAGTDIFFNPLTQSAVVADPNSVVESTSPWLVPPGISQTNLTSMSEIEADINQSTVRVPGAGSSASMWDMVAFDHKGENIFIPHETPFGAGASRYNIAADRSEVLFRGDLGGANNNWANDWAAFDPSTYTPNGTLLVAEEWAGEGRVLEILNPHAPAGQIQMRELESIANVAHEGLRFSADEKTLYFVDEWNSGAFYKFVLAEKGDYTKGQTFVLKVDAYGGNPADNYNEPSNANQPRTGPATWIPLTDVMGNPLTAISPFRNGPTNDPRTSTTTRGGRPAADEVGATPYGRPEDMEVAKLANGREVLYVAVTSEHAIYAIEMLGKTKAHVRVAASRSTPKNLGFLPTSGTLNSPDNLAQDALGNIYIIEDAPNGSAVGGDIWFMRDTNNDGIAESLDHFLTIQVAGSEATGMIFNPVKPTEFVIAVQHPSSVDMAGGFGDGLWQFDLKHVAAPPCDPLGKEADRGYGRWDDDHGSKKVCYRNGGRFIKELEEAHERACSDRDRRRGRRWR